MPIPANLRGEHARLAASLILAIAGIAIGYAALVGFPVRARIDNVAIRQVTFDDGRKAYAVLPSHRPELLPSDSVRAADASRLQLLEDARPLGPPHSPHAEVANPGKGRYSHWNGWIYFQPSDNSDPRSNGRRYEYADHLRLPRGFALAGGLCLLALLWLARGKLASAARLIGGGAQRLAPPPAVAASLLLMALSLSWLFQLAIAARRDVSRADIFSIIAYCVVVVAMQARLLSRAGRHATALFAAIALVNTYSLYFVFSGEATTYPWPMQVLILWGMAAFYAMLFRIVQASARWRGPLLGAALLGAAALGIAAARPFVAPQEPTAVTPDSFPGMRLVEFQRKPNVYFLGFDAMTPGALADRLLGIPRPGYLDVVEKHHGRLLRNLFADEVPTQSFWAALLSVVRKPGAERIAAGMDPSLVLVTFQRNGYKTHFTFANTYLGAEKGPYLDSYGVADLYSTCSFLDELPRRYGFLGFCALLDTDWFYPTTPESPRTTERREAFYLERLRSVTRAPQSGPHFFAAHYPLPGHTELRYRRTPGELADFARGYRARSAAAARLLDAMLTEIRAADPTAIVLVFGDHGAWVARGLEYADAPEFVVHDRHGILGALFGAEGCESGAQAAARTYRTAAGVVAELLECLAGGVSPLMTDHDFGRITQAPGTMRFEDYPYE